MCPLSMYKYNYTHMCYYFTIRYKKGLLEIILFYVIYSSVTQVVLINKIKIGVANGGNWQ